MSERKALAIALLVLLGGCSEDPPMTGVLAGSGAPIGVTGGSGPTVTGGTTAGGAGTTGIVGSSGNTAPSPTAGTPGTGGVGGSEPPMTAAGAGGAAAPGDCKGLDFTGMVYSPGGTVLPNKCMPFHPTTNNPYAVRCIDAWPWYKTQFPGDDFCILPPPPDKGIQYGVHPQGKAWFEQVSKGDLSGYMNVGDEWTMEPGEEEEGNYLTGATNTTEMKFYRNSPRMRPGSHHMIVSSNPDNTSAQERWYPGSPDGLFGGGLPGAQRPDENAPKSLDKPMEDAGLYSVLVANPPITFNMHHFNSTSQPILKEAWTNLWWEEQGTTRVYGILGLELLQVATLSVPPGATRDLHYSWTIDQPIRLVTTFGHRHAWTTNFTAWVEKPGGMLDIIYQSFDWFDEPTYRYDSQTQNPPPAPEARTDGASSGVRMLNPGEKLHFNCHIEFTDERAAAEMTPKRPAEIGNLRFANQAFNAEMCILFGSTAAVQLPTPAADSSPLPPFATID